MNYNKCKFHNLEYEEAIYINTNAWRVRYKLNWVCGTRRARLVQFGKIFVYIYA